jgi:hypothetical protein
VVFAVGKQRVAIVSLDLGRAPTRKYTEAIRQRVQAAGVGHIFLVASHTHHGPVLELETWPKPEAPYVRTLEEKLAGVILDAVKQLRPARLGVAAREVALNRNRHSKRPDRPVDRELLVMKVEGEDDKPIAHLVNFAAHPTMLDVKLLKFSADYPGAMAALVEKETEAPCLFLQGAAGDLSTEAGEERGPERFGQALGKRALELAKGIKCTIGKDTKLQARAEEFKFGTRVDLGNPVIKALYSAAFFPALIEFYEREYREGIRPHLTTALLDGRVGIVGVSGEFFCGHALSLRRRARLEHVLFLGYCNDYHQYFPTIEGASEGGYGADAQVAPVEPGAGERMMDRALVHLYQMRGKLKNLELKR